jgi:hypothetical protein
LTQTFVAEPEAREWRCRSTLIVSSELPIIM